MTLGKGLRQLGIAPCGVQNLLDIIGEKIGKRFPGRRVIQCRSNRNELLVVSLKGNDWTAEPLLLFANSFGSSLLFESTSDVCRVARRRRLIASGVASAAFFEFQSAATRAGLIAPSFHDVAAYTGTRSGRIRVPISGMNDSE